MSREPHSTGKLRQQIPAVLLACALGFAPGAAWAHGDHEGAHGIVHLLTEPLHLGVLLLAGLAALTLGRRAKAALRKRTERRIAEKVRRD